MARLAAARPLVIDVVAASEVSAHHAAGGVSHAGPPIEPARMCAPMRAALGIPARLSEYRGTRAVTKTDIPRLVEIATDDICHQTNPRKCAASDFAALFAAAI